MYYLMLRTKVVNIWNIMDITYKNQKRHLIAKI